MNHVSCMGILPKFSPPSRLSPQGYPYNLDFDYGALEKLVKFSINNLGDPFIESNYGVHSREFEVSHGWFCPNAVLGMKRIIGRASNFRCPLPLRSILPSLHTSDLSFLPCTPQVGVLNWFAKLWEIDAEEYWGYITTCGTEGNLHGILTGRENLPDGILYASQVRVRMWFQVQTLYYK